MPRTPTTWVLPDLVEWFRQRLGGSLQVSHGWWKFWVCYSCRTLQIPAGTLRGNSGKHTRAASTTTPPLQHTRREGREASHPIRTQIHKRYKAHQGLNNLTFYRIFSNIFFLFSVPLFSAASFVMILTQNSVIWPFFMTLVVMIANSQ